MKRFHSLVGFFLVCAIFAVACEEPPNAVRFKSTHLKDLPLTASDPTLMLRWPQFLFAAGPRRFLWGEGRDIVALLSRGPALNTLGERMIDVTVGLDRITAADRSSDGTLALVDSSGLVVVRDGLSGTVRSFKSHQWNPVGDLTVGPNGVFLLLEGDLPHRPAVSAYSLDGEEIGTWGQVGVQGILESSTNGGGITTCPDGAVYYSYINDRKIFRIRTGERPAAVEVMGKSPTFEKISVRKARAAYQTSRESHSVVPVVRLALSGSRVLALQCSDDGILFRQVAHPGGNGATVEAWNPGDGNLIATFDTGQGVLFDVHHHVLYFGAVTHDGSFVLERIGYEISAGVQKEG